jgi:hypothetical protein
MIKAKDDVQEEEVKTNKADKNCGVIPGTILIVLGIIFLLPRLGVEFGNLWPTFILAPGLSFILFFLVSQNKKKTAAILIPGVILTLLSIFFYYQSFNGWWNADKLWPVYPFAVGLSFYVFYFASGRHDKGILIPANILSCFGIIFLILNYYTFNFWPLLLIIAGLIFILSSIRKR